MSFWFSKEDIIYLHSTILMKTGGEDGIRDEGMLELALATPLLAFDFNDLYPTIIDKLARLSFGLVMNHPFLDGNKRIGAYTLIVGLKINKIPFSFDDDDAIEEFFALADGKINYDSFKNWVRSKIH